MSLTKTSAEVERIVGSYDACDIAKRETEVWLTTACAVDVNVDQVVKEIREKESAEVGFGVNKNNYSVAQLCELHECKEVYR